jgi:hypothetical protein
MLRHLVAFVPELKRRFPNGYRVMFSEASNVPALLEADLLCAWVVLALCLQTQA